MSSSTLIEVFGQILFRFTRGVTEHYNPDEPEFTSEIFGYNPLESTGREWYCQPVDELIYQEYSDREATSLDYLAHSSVNVRLINACSTEEETREDQQDQDRAMAWKRLRPSALHTVCKSMYIGALISLLVATSIGTLYTLISYVRYETYLSYNYLLDCQIHSNDSLSVKIQWTRTICGLVECVFLHSWLFIILLFLFRPFQLMGVTGKLFLVCFLFSCLDALYRVTVQDLKLSHVIVSNFLTFFPLNVLFFISACLQMYMVTNHFCTSSRKKKLTLFFQIIVPGYLPLLVGQIAQYFLYAAYNRQNNEGKLSIAVFAPLIGVVLKIISRICVQRLYHITHPGYSYVLLLPLYYGSAIMFRVLQAELDSLQSIAVLGIIHGAGEVIERSTMVLFDHICYLLWKRKSAPWGSFRTPRRERLMADIAIMSMMSESTAIVSVNGFIYLYQFACLHNGSILQLLHKFAIRTSVPLVIEWFFTSVSLAIETRYQNMAVMAVWRRRWKRHILVAIVNVVPLAIYTSEDLLKLVRGHLSEACHETCKMPFT